jgi:nucleoid DNA-binding protein
MITITKHIATQNVAKRTGVSQRIVKEVLEGVLAELLFALGDGQRVEFRGFGTWEIRMAKAKMGRNPHDPNSAPVVIPARPVLRFKMSADLKSAVRSAPILTNQPEELV